MSPKHGFEVEMITNGYLYQDATGVRLFYPDLPTLIADLERNKE